MDRDDSSINNAEAMKIHNSKYNLIFSIIWFIPFFLISLYSIVVYYLPGSYLGFDFFIYTLLSITAIQFIILLVKHTLKNISEFKKYSAEQTEQVRKLYTARFVTMLILPIIVFVLSFYIFIIILDQIYSGMWLLGGGMLICAVLALITTSALVHFLAYSNTIKIKKDISLTTYEPSSILKSSKKILWLTIIYSVLIILPLLYFTIYNLTHSSVSAVIYHNDNQQYEKVSKFVSYTDKDEFMSNFLIALNSKNLDDVTTFYSKDQKGSDVIGDAKWLIDLVKTNGEFAGYEFSEFSPCSIDAKGNLYLFVDLNNNSGGTSIHIIKNTETKTHHAIANMEIIDTKYTDCPKN